MKRMFNYNKANGILMLIVPYYLFERDNNFASKFTNRYDVESVYKFYEKEFRKYKQIAQIGKRKHVLKEEEEVEKLLHNHVIDIDNVEL